ncbi:MAG TPA: hypothetical protein VFM18_17695 [Methanosarcina sp.]|nr:hypothetical protein [Methanosarcina sp.]
MLKFIAGTIFGIVITTVGMSGVVKVVDKGVVQVQAVAKDVAK